MVELIGRPLGLILGWCYALLKDYALAIAFFTLLTKLILLPVSIWVQRNGIAMVALTPELNRLKIKYFGDKDAIAEEQQALYKREHYHPLLGTIPMFIQLILLLGVIGAVRQVLAGTGSVLTGIPWETGGVSLLMPLAAGISALVLGFAQNRLNPLQREQSRGGQISTNTLSIAISLLLGAFVPLGVGLYWICSNLFTIAQQLLLNALVRPSKYIDYEALTESRRELAKIDSLGKKISPEDRKREKADYKRFFSIANKHLVFYSESSGFYKYFKGLIEQLLCRSNVTIHYITSDPKDQIFEIAKSQPRIKPYYIGEKRLITLMMKMDADMVVMTMPDLDNFHIKRSYVRKDIEYIYIFHAMVSTQMIYRLGSFDHYDTVLCCGPHHITEIREAERLYALPEKRLVEFGYPLLDELRSDYAALDKKTDGFQVVIAPSHHNGNIMDSCLDEILLQVLDRGWTVIVRPHPQYVRRNPEKLKALMEKYADKKGLRFETDFSSSESTYSSNVMITDWSGVSMEYSFASCHPCIFINTPMKVLNPEYDRITTPPLEVALRSRIGVSVDLDKLDTLPQTIDRIRSGDMLPEEEIDRISRESIFNVGSKGVAGAQYIIGRLAKDLRK